MEAVEGASSDPVSAPQAKEIREVRAAGGGEGRPEQSEYISFTPKVRNISQQIAKNRFVDIF